MKVKDIFDMSEICKASTALTIIKDGRQSRGKWFQYHILNHSEDEVLNISYHVPHDSLQILVEGKRDV